MPRPEAVILSCVGYRASWWRTAAFWLLVVLSGGCFRLCVALFPQLRKVLLTKCALPKAQYVQVQLVDGRQKFVPVHIQVVVALPEWGQLTNNVAAGRPLRLQIIYLFLQGFAYSEQHGTFLACPAMPMHLHSQICKALDYLHLVNHGGDWSHFNASYAAHRRSMARIYQTKRNLYDIKELCRPIVRHGVIPIVFIQYLECIYLMTRGYYIFPTIVFAFSLAGQAGLISRIRQQHKTMSGMISRRGILPLVHRGWVRALPAWKLVPGDVVVLQRGKATCDMVLLKGSCLVEESMLSGEAAQVRKSGYVADPGVQYDPDSYTNCTVYAGTIVRQVWHAQDPEEEVLAMVVRTGLHTCMGSMIRQILSPSFAPAEKHPILWDVFKLYLFALTFQVFLFIPYAIRAAHFHESRRGVLYWLLNCIVQAAPSGLPALRMLIASVNIIRLDLKGIKLAFPEALRLVSVATIACFDKTGTLTGSTAELHGIIPANGGQFEGLQQNGVRWSNRLRQAAAVCHGITMVHKTLLAGEPMERSMFKLVEAHFLDRQTVLVPLRDRVRGPRQTGTLHMLKVFEFNSQILMSGSLVTANSSSDRTGLLFVKGAHTAVKKLLPDATLPADYDIVVDGLSKRSFRLMAMAVGTIPNVHRLDLSRMSQQQVSAHASGFELLCLVVLSNHVRPDSKDTLTQLQDGGGMRTMMITGDYHHTAISVAKDVGMLTADSQVLVIDAGKQPQPSSQWPSSQQPSSQQPSASAEEIQAVTDHSKAAGTTSAALHQQGFSAWQTSEVGAAQIPAKHVAWSEQVPLPSQSHAESQSTSDPERLQHAAGTAKQRSPVHLSTQPKGTTPLLTGIGSNAACQGTFQEGMSSRGDSPSHAVPSSLLLADSTARHAVLQSTAATLVPAGTTPAGTNPQPELGSLRFIRGDDNVEWNAMQALTALAEGRMQCAVTGEAFQLLLQLPDVSALDAVMRSVVVFARMKPHQKGQVMNLLNARGLYQMRAGKPRHIQGLQHTVLFCGDGINDLSALSSADIGYAVGATEASVAASAHTVHNSVAGLCSFVKEGKCSQSLSIAMYKYMIGYKAIESMASSIIFAINGSRFSRFQLGCIDFVGMTTAIAAVAGIGPLKQLRPIRPDPQICVPSKLVVMAVSYLYGWMTQAAVLLILISSHWYQGSNQTADYNPVVTAGFLSVLNQLLVVSMSLIKDVHPFCDSPLRSKPFMVLVLAYFTTSIALIMAGPLQSANLFHLYTLPKSYRVIQLSLLLSAAFGYGIVMGVIKHAIKNRQHRQIVPA